MKDTVLITGATGFLGEYLVKRLAGRYRVLALGRNREKGRQLEKSGAVFCPGDFTDKESCAGYFKGVRYVIHAGALSSVWGKWEEFYQANVVGTSIVAQLSYENRVSRLIYLSSPSIYSGREDLLDIREEQAPGHNRLNDYIMSKLMAEREIRSWHKKGLETVILRPRGLIGIGDTSLVPRLMRANSRTGIPLFREGKNLVDLTSVENVALACELAMTAEGASGQVFNITNGEPREFRRILEQFLRAAGEQPRYLRLPFWAAYGAAGFLEMVYRLLGLKGEPALTRYTVCTLAFAQTMNIGRAREILGYKPEKTLNESINEYGKWWKEQKDDKDTQKLHGPSLIEEVRLYHCGCCTNNLAILFRGQPWKKRSFPALSVLIRHKVQGNILYDTGYSEQIFQKGIFLTIYRLLNPVSFRCGQRIDQRLLKDGIDPGSIKTIILSHAHPDHVGGLSGFCGYKLIAFKEVQKVLEKPKLSDLLVPGLFLQKGLKVKQLPENRLSNHFLCRYFEQVYDLFGDGSIIGVRLDGHCKGQLGLWIPDIKLFLAADACWGGDLVSLTRKMRMIPRLIHQDFSKYQDTLRRICRLKRDFPEIRVVFSHGKGKEIRWDNLI